VIAVCQPDTVCPPGHLAEVLEAADVPWGLVRLHAGDALPSDPDAVVVLGGRMGVDDVADHPWIPAVEVWLAGLVEREVPVLGICLGAQLLAESLGGTVRRAARPEIAVRELEVLADDPLAPRLDGPWVLMHRDVFTAPPGATLVARTAHPAGFRLGSAFALQPHPEAPAETVAGWLAEATEVVAESGVDAVAMAERLAAESADLADRGRALLGAWLEGALAAGR
jgi:GMP synthase-like glutamine amidotransferase